MSWRDRLLSGSYRGVPFSVESHDVAGGFRTHKHKYSGKAGQFAEQIGPESEDPSFNAFIIGPDYDQKRDDFLNALRKSGFGELVHPYLGVFNVKAESWNLSESNREGGVARFTLNFVTSDDQKYPLTGNDSRGKIESDIEVLNEALVEDFDDSFDVTSYPSFVAESASEKLGAVSDSISETTSFFFGQSDSITDLAIQLSDLKNDASTLVNTPADVANSIISSISLLNKAADIDGASFSLFDFGEDDIYAGGDTASRAAQQSNSKAINRLVQVSAVASACDYATGANFETHSDALIYQKSVFDAIDDIVDRGVSDTVYDALYDLKTSFNLFISEGSANLPRIRSYNVDKTFPVLVLSQRIYGNALMADDISLRNDLEYPGFVEGGSALSVLVNV